MKKPKPFNTFFKRSDFKPGFMFKVNGVLYLVLSVEGKIMKMCFTNTIGADFHSKLIFDTRDIEYFMSFFNNPAYDYKQHEFLFITPRSEK